MLHTQWCDMDHNISDSNSTPSQPSDIMFFDDASFPDSKSSDDWSSEMGADIHLLEAIVNYIYPQISFYISADPSRPMATQYTAYNAGPAVNILDALMDARDARDIPQEQVENIRVMTENGATSLTNH